MSVAPDRLPPWARHTDDGYVTDTPITDGVAPLVVSVLVAAALVLALILTL